MRVNDVALGVQEKTECIMSKYDPYGLILYLRSTELREPYTPRRCTIIKRVFSEVRDDMMLVEIKPPLPPHIYGSKNSIEFLILGSRFKGDTLFPVCHFPLSVYICGFDSDALNEDGHINSADLQILDWGEVDKKK